METAVMLMQCPDTKGIVARLSSFIYENNGNIVHADQYSTDPVKGQFFIRIEFYFDENILQKKVIEDGFQKIAKSFEADLRIYYKSYILKMGILVSKHDHCLADLLYLWKTKELNVEIPFVISNHNELQTLVESYNIPFHHIPVLKGDKADAEMEMLKIAKGSSDFLVLARYMQIISNDFINQYNKDIINIHHSFLPSFKGADPYRQAYERGVKIIGATAHFVTKDLDEGPIIEQVVTRVSHNDDIDILKRKGKNLEKIALSNAIHSYIDKKIIRFCNKTIVFN